MRSTALPTEVTVFQKGDLVQMTRLGLHRQKKGNAAARHPKTEKTTGVFVQYDGWVYEKPRHPTALVKWHLDGYNSFEQHTRVDYLEPLGTPR